MAAQDRFTFDDVLSLRNRNCPYCGKRFAGKASRNREHVIGRQFVPDGALQDQWNLILWACTVCNSEKGTLEREISAISMHPDAYGHHAVEDKRIADTLARKASGAVSERTQKLVVDSSERLSWRVRLMNHATITFDFVAPPQTDEKRTLRLAMLHVQAFFYLCTYRDSDRLGELFPGLFLAVEEASRSDWGNERLAAFADMTKDWEHRVHALGADGYFKIMIRRAPGERALWAWAVEWNARLRNVGFFGDEAAAKEAEAVLPKLKVKSVPGGYLAHRREVPLDEEADILFAPWSSTDEPAPGAAIQAPNG